MFGQDSGVLWVVEVAVGVGWSFGGGSWKREVHFLLPRVFPKFTLHGADSTSTPSTTSPTIM
jgi:hypothetical protein